MSVLVFEERDYRLKDINLGVVSGATELRRGSEFNNTFSVIRFMKIEDMS